MRGGTSKGLFFHHRDMPKNEQHRNALLLRALGSPDPYGKQIDGLGGATSSTSKAVIIGPSNHKDCDIDYLFAHIAIDQPLVDLSGNCGNLTAAAAVFAVEEGYVKSTNAGHVTVRIWQKNLNQRIDADVPLAAISQLDSTNRPKLRKPSALGLKNVLNFLPRASQRVSDNSSGAQASSLELGQISELDQGQVQINGDLEIAGLPWPGAEIKLRFLQPGGAITGKLLPSGNIVDRISLAQYGEFEVSMVDAGNPCVFIEAAQLGLSGREIADDPAIQPFIYQILEAIRAHCAVIMGLSETAEQATKSRPGTPKIVFIAKPADYRSSNGSIIKRKQCDILARIVSMGKLHHAYTGTGAIATVVASHIPGSIVSRHCTAKKRGSLLIGHNAGVMPANVEIGQVFGKPQVISAGISRTARRLMEGNVLLPSFK